MVSASVGAPFWPVGPYSSETARSRLPIRICFYCPPLLVALFAQPVLNSWIPGIGWPNGDQRRMNKLFKSGLVTGLIAAAAFATLNELSARKESTWGSQTSTRLLVWL